ncbi:MAG: hypothetical protein IJ008_02245 [Clostridia bacterium]|nr:hypothetical protein [Clostridia bacterium]
MNIKEDEEERINKRKTIIYIVCFVVLVALVVGLYFIFRKKEDKRLYYAIMEAKIDANYESRDFDINESFGVNLKNKIDCLVYNVDEKLAYVYFDEDIYEVKTSNFEIKKKKDSFEFATMFDSVKDMKNAKLKKGDLVATKGYHKAYDGGEGLYKIQNKDVTCDDGKYIRISDSLVAKLQVFDDTVSILQYGYKTNCDASVYEKFFNSNYKCLYFPKGEYAFENSYELNLENKNLYGLSAKLKFKIDDDKTYGLKLNNLSDVRIIGLEFLALSSNENLSQVVEIGQSENVYFRKCKIIIEENENIQKLSCLSLKEGLKNITVDESFIENNYASSQGELLKIEESVEDISFLSCEIVNKNSSSLLSVVSNENTISNLLFDKCYFNSKNTPETMFKLESNLDKNNKIKFSYNTIKGKSKNSLFSVKNISDLNINGNKIVVESQTDGDYIMFDSVENKTKDACDIFDNKITFKTNDKFTTLTNLNHGNIYRNTFKINGDCPNNLFAGYAKIYGNEFVVEGDVKNVMSNIKYSNYNEVTIKGVLTGVVCEFKDIKIKEKIEIFNCKIKIANNKGDLFGFYGEVYLNGNIIEFKDDSVIFDKGSGTYICEDIEGLKDVTSQKIFVNSCKLGKLSKIATMLGVVHNIVVN